MCFFSRSFFSHLIANFRRCNFYFDVKEDLYLEEYRSYLAFLNAALTIDIAIIHLISRAIVTQDLRRWNSFLITCLISCRRSRLLIVRDLSNCERRWCASIDRGSRFSFSASKARFRAFRTVFSSQLFALTT